MVLLPPAGTTWHRYSSLSTALARGDCEAAPSSAPLTTCWGLMRYRWSEGTPSCPCRMTEMILVLLELLSTCHQDVTEAHIGSRPTGHTWTASPPGPPFSQLRGWTPIP